jgi:hypothetical protein
MALRYCPGYVLQVMGWHVQESNGGVKTPHPVFLSRQLVGTLFIVAMNVLIYGWLCAAAELLKPGHGPADPRQQSRIAAVGRRLLDAVRLADLDAVAREHPDGARDGFIHLARPSPEHA